MFPRLCLAVIVYIIAARSCEAKSPVLCRVLNAYTATKPEPDSLSGSAITDWAWVGTTCTETNAYFDSGWTQASSGEVLSLVFGESNIKPFKGLELRKTFDITLASDGSNLSSAHVAIQFRGEVVVDLQDGSQPMPVQVCMFRGFYAI